MLRHSDEVLYVLFDAEVEPYQQAWERGEPIMFDGMAYEITKIIERDPMPETLARGVKRVFRVYGAPVA